MSRTITIEILLNSVWTPFEICVLPKRNFTECVDMIALKELPFRFPDNTTKEQFEPFHINLCGYITTHYYDELNYDNFSIEDDFCILEEYQFEGMICRTIDNHVKTARRLLRYWEDRAAQIKEIK